MLIAAEVVGKTPSSECGDHDRVTAPPLSVFLEPLGSLLMMRKAWLEWREFRWISAGGLSIPLNFLAACIIFPVVKFFIKAFLEIFIVKATFQTE